MSEVVLKFLMSSQARAKRSRLPRLRGREKGLFRAGPPSTCGLAPLPCRLPRSGAGGEGAFPRVSVHRLRRVNPQALAGQKLSLPPQGQFAEKQPPRRLSGALLFRPFSWACKKKARSKGYFPSSFSDPAWLLFAPYPMLSHPDRESQLRMSDLFSRCSEIRSASFAPAAR